MATDMYKTIEGSDENEIPIYHFEAYNRKQKACIMITKTINISDKETDTYQKKKKKELNSRLLTKQQRKLWKH